MTASNCLEYLNLGCKYDVGQLKAAAMEMYFANKKELLVTAQRDPAKYASISPDVLECMGLRPPGKKI